MDCSLQYGQYLSPSPAFSLAGLPSFIYKSIFVLFLVAVEELRTTNELRFRQFQKFEVNRFPGLETFA